MEGVTEGSVRAAGDLGGLCGLWEMAPGGAKVAVVEAEAQGVRRTLASGLLFVIIDTPRAAIEPGTVLGWAEAAAQDGAYRATLFTRADADTLSAPRRFVLRLDGGGSRMSMVEVKTGLKFVPWRMFPFLFRRALREQSSNDQALDGFIRLFPETSGNPPARPRRL